ncbi:MAG: molybdopterin-dependent oxidoreductase [Actinomycetia bacterium]|nr:molybdopterin-dependent oxidoreductase [Actinomycetes bacterium]
MTIAEPSLEPTPESELAPEHHTPRWVGALAGAAAATTALGVGELVAGFSHTFPSLIPSVGRLFVSETPGSVIRQTIQIFGTNQKPLLLTGITVTTIVLGAVFGVLGIRSRPAGIAGFVGFAVFGGLMALDDPVASNTGAILVAAAAGVAGVGALVILLGIALSTPVPTTAETPTNSHHGRRAFLLASGGVAGLGAVTAVGGQRLQSSNSVEAARAEVDLPMAGSGATATTLVAPSEADLSGGVDGLSSLITPNDQFYLIDTALVPPQVDPAGWSMTVKGMVDTEITLTYDDLLARDLVEEIVTLSCVSNEVGGRLVGNALWQGVPLRELLEEAGADPSASQIVGRSVDGWTAGFPTEILTEDRVAMVAVGMNGEPLPVKHGFPARLVVEGLYGYVSATKWLSEVELTTWEAFDGYWVPRGWSKLGPIKTQSRIDVPGNGPKVAAGVTPIAGVAWAPSRGIDRVEVQVDDGPWVEALMSESIGDGAWRQWMVDWNATPGQHQIRCRATDSTETTQPQDRSTPAPSGATGWHSIEVNVEA